MKLNWKKLVPALLFIVFLVFGFWYTQETTIQGYVPELDPALCQSITARYFIHGERQPEEGMKEVTLRPGDPAFDQLVELVRNQKFARSLAGLLPQKQSVRAKEGVFQWELLFEFDRVERPDGSGHSGQLLRIHNWFGTLEITFAHLDETWRDASTGNKTAWSAQVLETIRSAEGA